MNFFVLRNPKAGHGDAVTDYLPVDGSKIGIAPRCPICQKYLGMLVLLPPVRVELKAWGPRWGDVAFGPGDQILISDRLKNLFFQTGLIGFERLDPVDVVKTKKLKSGDGDPPNYWLASIQRSRAAIDETASGLVQAETPTCNECRIGGIIRHLCRIVLQANTWSGEDVFYARGLPGTVLVSERFKYVCDENGLANCSFVAAEDFSLCPSKQRNQN
jgi:hypothetical protein